MKNRKSLSLFAGAVTIALALGACSSNDADDVVKGGDDGAETGGGTVAFTTGAEEYAGYNTQISANYSTGNRVVADRMGVGFGYFNANGEWQKGTELGDYEMVSEDPLTIKYTINEAAVYEGGTPITCEDYYMDWVSQNPQWIMDAQEAAGNTDDAGNTAPLFDNVSSPASYANPVANGPECEAGDRSFTITYSEPNPDWELVVSGALPSHVVAEALDMSKEDLFKALKDQDFEVAQKAADFWNNWYSPNPGELQPREQVPSYGPYTYKDGGWQAGEYITLVRNPDWWGEPAATEEFVIRQVAPEGQIQALANGDVNVIEPQATQDAIDTLNATDGVSLLTGSTMIWEHLDYNWAETSVFHDNHELREAFAYCVPRQEIVDKLIKPLNPDAEVMNAREYFPTDSDYQEVVNHAYDGRYDEVDIEKAKELIAASGVENPTVRIGYSAPNQRRADQVSLIRSSCQEAGFTIEDIGAENFFAPDGALSTGQFDVALFAWSGSGQIVSGANIYETTGQQNFSKWANDEVDSEWARVRQSLDPAEHLDAKKNIEKLLWDELYNLPVFAHPGVAAHTDGLKNVERNVTQVGIPWNAEKWAW
ncbi:peptide/nickel transport system substrate-binding protein [Trueperella bonasi]|uniref:Peptide/nickel transport system substrate-binding protein n=1 Tax=Trueperella bonasi TaxID=312286 RepID=A0ABT9NGV6_9ACTO|nr:ABC transporter substrate-binding protein [Trueperella bonasi]MDP9806427.1 peptide/nickel transport system substrate-binding protein [Trueperella bonasi]